MKRSRIRNFYFIAILAALVFTVFLYRSLNAPLIEDELTELTVFQQKQLEMYVEMNKLLITLGTLLLGAIGAMLAHFYEAKPISPEQTQLVLFSSMLAGGSILCGYLSYQHVIAMFQASFFNLSNPRVSWSGHAQFYLFLASTALAASFGYRALREET
jgi:uncharacterized membrane protein